MVVTQAPRLMKPSAKVSARLERTAISAYALESGQEYLDAEVAFTLTRSALVHLVHNEWPPGIERKVAEVVEVSRKFLNAEGAQEAFPKLDFKKLGAITDTLEAMAKKIVANQRTSKEQVGSFITVVHRIRSLHLEEGYDPSGIVAPNVYAIAQMIVENFSAYDLTLNT